jgi:BCCT family betaine/carnitine transporter
LLNHDSFDQRFEELAALNQSSNNNRQVCRQSFATCLALLSGLCALLVLFPEQSAVRLESAYATMSSNFGALYLFAGVACFLFLVSLGLSRYGRIKLGDQDDTAEFNEFSWAGMLFCAGVGAAMLRWALVEWSHYYYSPPHGIVTGSNASKDWASAYPLFHWGPIAWSFYCLPAITIAYPFYVKKVPFLRLSTSLYGILGEKGLEGPIAKSVDILFVLSLLGGAGYSLGVSTPVIAGTFCHLTGLQNGFYMRIIVALLCVAIFSTSVYFGLRKGIKLLSDWNVYLAMVLLCFIFLAGPTVFIVKTSISSLGFMAQNFFVMSTWMDPFTDSTFVEDWTVFYWAWWVAYAPFVGLFVARISRGREIRQVIFGMLTYGSLGGMLFFMIMGNYAMHQEIVENSGILSTMIENSATDGEAYVTAIIQVLETLPLAGIVVGVFCLICVIFCATTYDSASYIIASTVTKNLHAGEDPAKWNRVFWAFALAALPLALMWIGAEKVMQSVLLLTSFPILFIGALSAFSVLRTIRNDSEKVKSEELQ